MVLPAPVRVPASLLAWLVTDANLGELHKTLAPEALWLPPAGQDALRRQGHDMLTELGWRDRHGKLEREVAGSLTVLCRPRVEYYGWIAHDEQTIGVLAGRIGKEAVLAVNQPGSTIWLTSVNSTRLAERLVAQTPDMPAGRGGALTVSPAEVRATRRDGRQRTPAGVGVRRAGPEVRDAQRLAALPTTGHGELSVAKRDELGRRHRYPRPVRYTDTSEGRFVLLFDSDDQVRVEPAGRVELVRHLERMVQALP
ncbi:ESX secretion-associated protein EspG [Actinophytocola gossypii]|uniref:ESX secretion-associated protein EspG n=1 Tax=Actinophytocola gossypii TaxID=2812003 RepID=A0ABT2J3E4_9PSEU|nr:ESX secretion-associated protein EspG [Actinophytocola gossypii]MCT2582372.1 ESX secretion-associated protein EspG [Actinophytocola gossypii]